MPGPILHNPMHPGINLPQRPVHAPEPLHHPGTISRQPNVGSPLSATQAAIMAAAEQHRACAAAQAAVAISVAEGADLASSLSVQRSARDPQLCALSAALSTERRDFARVERNEMALTSIHGERASIHGERTAPPLPPSVVPVSGDVPPPTPSPHISMKAAASEQPASDSTPVGVGWQEERGNLVRRLEAAEAATMRMHAAADLWKNEHGRLEEALASRAQGEVDGARANEGALLRERQRAQALEHQLDAEREAHKATTAELEAMRETAQVAARDMAAREEASEAARSKAEAAMQELLIRQQREGADASIAMMEGVSQLDRFAFEASSALSAVLHEHQLLRMGWADLEQRDAAVKAAHEAVATTQEELEAERKRLSGLAAERTAIAQGHEAVRDLLDELLRERGKFQIDQAARDEDIAMSMQNLARREAAAAVATKGAAETVEVAERRMREADERAVESVAQVRREASVEVDEMHTELLSEAVAVASLAEDLMLLERTSEARFDQAAHAHDTALTQARQAADAEVSFARAQTDAALQEHAGLQAAAEEAHALCEAFDGQLRAASLELTEREVFVCILLAELRADDVAAAAASTPSVPPPAQQSKPAARPESGLPKPRAVSHLGLAARSRRDGRHDELSVRPDDPTFTAAESEASTALDAAAPVASSAWEQVRLEQELQAALDAAAAAQRSATAAEQQAAQQQASFALTLRREREKMRAEHQAAVAKIWQQVGDAEMGDSTPGANQPTSASP